MCRRLGDASEQTAERQWSKQDALIKSLEAKYRWKLNELGVSEAKYHWKLNELGVSATKYRWKLKELEVSEASLRRPTTLSSPA